MPTIKCVVVGDGAVGKSCLVKSYTAAEFRCADYVPTKCDLYAFSINGYTIDLLDTGGQEHNNSLRQLSYPQTDVLLVCFSVTQPNTFENVKMKWIPEITHHCPNIPLVLVGTQIDLRVEMLAKSNTIPITREQGEALANELNAVKYVECSALLQKNIEDTLNQNQNDSLLKIIIEAVVGATNNEQPTIQSMPTVELIRLNEEELLAEQQLFATYQAELFPKMGLTEDEEEAWRWAEDEEHEHEGPHFDPLNNEQPTIQSMPTVVVPFFALYKSSIEVGLLNKL